MITQKLQKSKYNLSIYIYIYLEKLSNLLPNLWSLIKNEWRNQPFVNRNWKLNIHVSVMRKLQACLHEMAIPIASRPAFRPKMIAQNILAQKEKKERLANENFRMGWDSHQILALPFDSQHGLIMQSTSG